MDAADPLLLKRHGVNGCHLHLAAGLGEGEGRYRGQGGYRKGSDGAAADAKGAHGQNLLWGLKTKGKPLLGAEDAVARIAQPGQDVAVVIELAINGRGVNGNVRVRLMKGLDALRAGEQAHELNGARV